MRGDRKGSSFVYVIAIVTLLGAVSTGFIYLVRFNTQSTLDNQTYLRHYYFAKSVHRSVCLAAENGELDVLGRGTAYSGDGGDGLPEGAAGTPEALPEADGSGSAEPEPAHHVGTGETGLLLADGTQVTVRVDLALGYDPEGGRQALIETNVRFTDTDAYRFCAQLKPERQGRAGHKWVAWRYYEGDGG